MKLYKVFGIHYNKKSQNTFRTENGMFGEHPPLPVHLLPKELYIVTDQPDLIEEIIKEETGWSVLKFKVHEIDAPVFISLRGGS